MLYRVKAIGFFVDVAAALASTPSKFGLTFDLDTLTAPNPHWYVSGDLVDVY
jgi:hypothetical protein